MIRYRLTSSLIVAFLTAFLMACGSADQDPDQNNENNTEPFPVNTSEPTNANNAEPDPVDAPGEARKSELSRETDPDVDNQTFADFTADNRDFAFSLFDQLREDEGDGENLFVSPHSISIALAMTYAGAEEDTREQMAEALQFNLDDDALHPAFNKLDQALDQRSEIELEEEEDQAFSLDVVNQTWGHDDFDFVDAYLDLLGLHYGAGMYVVDFVSDYEQIRKDINAWVEGQTNDRIEDLLPEDSLTEDTRFILVNAIYFYGTWENTFDEQATSETPFTLLDDTTEEVPMMRQDSRFGLFDKEDDDTIAVSMPYVGEEVSMVAFMPADEEDDFLQWEQDFTRQDFDTVIEEMMDMRVMLSFPRFEDDAEFELEETFEALGMIDAFDECDADFGGITGHPPCLDFKSLYIDEIYHQSFVSVDEEGTEAAAATAVVGDTPTSMPPSVTFDRPFYYAIYDHPTDTILFLGRMVDPS